ncbi:MAG: hypothetical protein O7D34_06925, partial [Ignavibacteria bacterium]|nr:hypothetical protein [Ignavibacteria bacterium]
MKILFVVLNLGLSSSSSMHAQGEDSTKEILIDTVSTAPRTVSQQDLRFPSQPQRLFLLAVAVITVGGLGVILNEKRKRADKRA